MTKKIALFMLGLATLGGTLGFVSANNYNSTTPSGFGLNESYSAGITGIAGTGQDQQNRLIDVIKTAINWVLGIL
ncbi:MAG: hypothetical protein Q4B28_07815 [bacterium]|nr:hypothetical protein [bacterium]